MLRIEKEVDGYNMLDYFMSGGDGPSSREEILFFTD
jgi:hypothetical protein